jgi:hypothetical protein
MLKRVGGNYIELRAGLTGYSLDVNNFQVMFFPAKDHADAREAYERLIYALS